MDLETGRFLGEVRGITSPKTGYVSSAAFSHAGDSVVVGMSNGEIKIYSIVTVG